MSKLNVSLVDLELKKKPSVLDFIEFRKQLVVADNVLITELCIQCNKRYFYTHEHWTALFKDVPFDTRQLKVSTNGMSTASLKTLLIAVKRLEA